MAAAGLWVIHGFERAQLIHIDGITFNILRVFSHKALLVSSPILLSQLGGDVKWRRVRGDDSSSVINPPCRRLITDRVVTGNRPPPHFLSLQVHLFIGCELFVDAVILL